MESEEEEDRDGDGGVRRIVRRWRVRRRRIGMGMGG